MERRAKRGLRRRYGHAKRPTWHEVKRHQLAFQSNADEVYSYFALLREIDQAGRKHLRWLEKEHAWILAHAETKA